MTGARVHTIRLVQRYIRPSLLRWSRTSTILIGPLLAWARSVLAIFWAVYRRTLSHLLLSKLTIGRGALFQIFSGIPLFRLFRSRLWL